MRSILYYFFKYRWSEVDILLVDNVYYEFTKLSGRLQYFGVLPQRYCHKSCRCLHHIFQRKKISMIEKCLDKQVEHNLRNFLRK